MKGSSRLWLVCTDDAPATYDLRRTAELLAGAPLRALYHASSGAVPAALAANAERRPMPFSADAQRDLAELAARHDGEQIALLAPSAFVRSAIALSLSARPDQIQAPAPGTLTVLDWPAPSDPEARPALIGVDLDWVPPPPPQQRARFPGGPGSAPSGRG